MQSNEHHGERAALWNATLPCVGFANAAVDAVVCLEVFGEPLVGTKNILWHSCKFSGLIDDPTLNLIKVVFKRLKF